MQNLRDIVLAFRKLELDGDHPVMVHASLSSFGQVNGGAEAVVGALVQHFNTVVMPTFTYKTMVMPGVGPENNASKYGSLSDLNKTTEFFHPNMPADKLMGVLPELLRKHRRATRSFHPILSFAGINAKEILEQQTLKHPFAPIAKLADLNAWVLLLGVGHKANTSIHLGERLAGRKTLTRWALVPDMVVECPGFPSCSDGFEAIEKSIAPFVRKITVGKALIQAMPLASLIETTRKLVQSDPLALLCNHFYCERCKAVRTEAGI